MPSRRKSSSRRRILARRKLAFIIGNNNYRRSGNKLEKSVEHAEKLKGLLEQMNFNVVAHTNVNTKDEMNRKVQAFNDVCATEDGDLILFYFSGHACQFDGKNYLIPTNETEIKAEDVAHHSNDAAEILKELRADKRRCTIIFILDCCRAFNLAETSSDTSKKDL